MVDALFSFSCFVSFGNKWGSVTCVRERERERESEGGREGEREMNGRGEKRHLDVEEEGHDS